MKHSFNLSYKDQYKFKQKMDYFLEMSKEELETNFNIADKDGNEDDCLVILLVLMRRKAVVHFNPVSKLICDICNSNKDEIIILKDCYHGYCRGCLINKVQQITETMNYEEYFEKQDNCKCDICHTPIKISNLVNLNILSNKKEGDSFNCIMCNKREEEEFIEMKTCHSKICRKRLIPYLEEKFRAAKKNSSLIDIICPCYRCGDNISSYLLMCYEENDILKHFPKYYEENFW